MFFPLIGAIINKRKGIIGTGEAYYPACMACEAQLSPQTASFSTTKSAMAWFSTEQGTESFVAHVCDADAVAKVVTPVVRKATKKQSPAVRREVPLHLAALLGGVQ